VTSAPRQDNSLKADAKRDAMRWSKSSGASTSLTVSKTSFERLQIPISRQTLCRLEGWCSDQVEPVVKAMADYILSQGLVQSDETAGANATCRWPDGDSTTLGLTVAMGRCGVLIFEPTKAMKDPWIPQGDGRPVRASRWG